MKIRPYIAKYELWLRECYSRDYVNRVDKALYNFFDRFPEKREATDFASQDARDYLTLRMREGAAKGTATQDLAALRAFWNWLREAVPEEILWNPFSGQVVRVEGKGVRVLRPEEVDLLVGAARTPFELRMLDEGLRGKTTHATATVLGCHRKTLFRHWRDLVARTPLGKLLWSSLRATLLTRLLREGCAFEEISAHTGCSRAELIRSYSGDRTFEECRFKLVG